ncbi:MAG TPA: class I SAM-dependent methyltransferase [Acidimicrobiales bacterium]|nr:class I SAM-dependent methyltransferase [Acidimicrobiales bacterium]
MKDASDNPWLSGNGVRGDNYDKRFDALASTGQNVHGEAEFVVSLGVGSVLDAGCGTGRVAIELARRGLDVAGIDLDASMLDSARQKAPELSWACADLSDPDLDLGRQFDAVVMAGNVMIFVSPGTEGAVLASAVRHLRRPGLVIAGFSLRRGGLGVTEYDGLATEAGLHLAERWSTWDRSPFSADDTYAVSVHRYDREP